MTSKTRMMSSWQGPSMLACQDVGRGWPTLGRGPRGPEGVRARPRTARNPPSHLFATKWAHVPLFGTSGPGSAYIEFWPGGRFGDHSLRSMILLHSRMLGSPLGPKRPQGGPRCPKGPLGGPKGPLRPWGPKGPLGPLLGQPLRAGYTGGGVHGVCGVRTP